MWRQIYHEFLRWAKISSHMAGGYKRTEITVETDQILVLSKSRPLRAWCAACGREVDVQTRNGGGALPVNDSQQKLSHDSPRHP
jgi:hypothetical protein